jgi:chromosome segregation ATPase
MKPKKPIEKWDCSFVKKCVVLSEKEQKIKELYRQIQELYDKSKEQLAETKEEFEKLKDACFEKDKEISKWREDSKTLRKGVNELGEVVEQQKKRIQELEKECVEFAKVAVMKISQIDEVGGAVERIKQQVIQSERERLIKAVSELEIALKEECVENKAIVNNGHLMRALDTHGRKVLEILEAKHG